jgi:hypothetical protein
MGIYVFVGTRQPGRLPFNVMALYRDAATFFAGNGSTVRAAGEAGSDRMAVDAALAAGGSVEVYLPHQSFGDEWIYWSADKYPAQVSTFVFDAEVHKEWMGCLREIYPNARHLSRASTANLARSCGMVLGATAVVALPFVRHHDRGVSGLLLGLARARGLVTYDLSHDRDVQALRAVLGAHALDPTG